MNIERWHVSVAKEQSDGSRSAVRPRHGPSNTVGFWRRGPRPSSLPVHLRAVGTRNKTGALGKHDARAARLTIGPRDIAACDFPWVVTEVSSDRYVAVNR